MNKCENLIRFRRMKSATLASLISHHDFLYTHRHEALISDAVFDQMVCALAARNPDHPLLPKVGFASPTKLPRQHPYVVININDKVTETRNRFDVRPFGLNEHYVHKKTGEVARFNESTRQWGVITCLPSECLYDLNLVQAHKELLLYRHYSMDHLLDVPDWTQGSQL